MNLRYLTLIALVTSGCVATDVGNPQTDPPAGVEAEISFEAYVSEPVPNALVLSDGVEITHAWMSVDEMRLRLCDMEEGAEDGEVEEGSAAPFVTDLLSGTAFPQTATLSEQLVPFCRLEFRLRPFEAAELPAGAPSDLVGRSILVRGTRKDGNPFVLYGTFDEKIELDGEIDLSDDILNRLVVGFAVNGWVSQGELAQFSGNPILIDDETAPDLLDDFRDRVKGSGMLFREATSGTPLAGSASSELE